MQLLLNTAKEQLLVTMNRNFRKLYFTLWKKTKHEIYFAPVTTLKLEGSNTKVSAQVPSVIIGEKSRLQNTSKGKCLGVSPHYVWTTLLLKVGPCNSL